MNATDNTRRRAMMMDTGIGEMPSDVHAAAESRARELLGRLT